MMREVLEVEEVLLMQNLTVLCIVYGCSIVDAKSEVSESGMNQFWPYPASPLAKTSEDNYWWDFWINVRKICNSDLYCEMKYLVWGGTRMKMVEIEDLGVRSRWDWRFDDEFVLTLILTTFEGLLLMDIDMMK